MFEPENERNPFFALPAVYDVQREHVAAGRRFVAVGDLQRLAVAFALLEFFNQWLDVGITGRRRQHFNGRVAVIGYGHSVRAAG